MLPHFGIKKCLIFSYEHWIIHLFFFHCISGMAWYKEKKGIYIKIQIYNKKNKYGYVNICQ